MAVNPRDDLAGGAVTLVFRLMVFRLNAGGTVSEVDAQFMASNPRLVNLCVSSVQTASRKVEQGDDLRTRQLAGSVVRDQALTVQSDPSFEQLGANARR